jgi:hypothetical protein
MKEAKVKPKAGGTRVNKSLIIAAILIFVSMVGFSVYDAVYQAHSLPKSTTVISQTALEQEYGLRVSLIGVTAAGGMVDVRLTIVDGEKAKSLLGDPKNYPSLFVDERYFLHTSDDVTKQTIRYENGSRLFVLFPNSRGVVKPGTAVSLVFGNTAVEPIPSE